MISRRTSCSRPLILKVPNHATVATPGGCFTKTKIDFKLDLTMAGRSCHCLLSPFTGIGLSREVQIVVPNLQNLPFLIVHY